MSVTKNEFQELLYCPFRRPIVPEDFLLLSIHILNLCLGVWLRIDLDGPLFASCAECFQPTWNVSSVAEKLQSFNKLQMLIYVQGLKRERETSFFFLTTGVLLKVSVLSQRDELELLLCRHFFRQVKEELLVVFLLSTVYELKSLEKFGGMVMNLLKCFRTSWRVNWRSNSSGTRRFAGLKAESI